MDNDVSVTINAILITRKVEANYFVNYVNSNTVY